MEPRLRRKLLILLSLALLGGCAADAGNSAGKKSLANPDVATDGSNSNAPPPGVNIDPSTVAVTVNGAAITIGDINRPMMEAYGLQFMLHLAQLELGRQHARAMGVSVSAEDVARERQRTLEQAFKEVIEPDVEKMEGSEEQKRAYAQKKYEEMLDKLLEVEHSSRAEFDIVMQVNTVLRKIAEMEVKDKLSEADLEAAFKIKYGEKVKVQIIELRNRQDAAKALRLLQDEKQPFEKVAREMSLDESSRQFGGVVRPFSRAEKYWPNAFKEAAFALNPGEISQQVNIGERTYLIRLMEKIPPSSAVKFEDHREILREEIYNLMAQARMAQLRKDIALEAGKAMKIQDPLLKKQYDQRMARTMGEVSRERGEMSRDLEMERPTTRPATGPAKLSTGSGVARPPATRPGLPAGQ